MATEFLDSIGLAYFWGKIKSWVRGIFVDFTTRQTITGRKIFSHSDYQMTLVNPYADITVFDSSRNIYWNLLFMDKNEVLCGRFLMSFNSNGTHTFSMVLCDRSAAHPTRNIIGGHFADATNYSIRVGDTNCTAFFPLVANITLGKNSNDQRWGQIYSSSTSISTSDERAKTSIASVPDEVLDAWDAVEWVQFQMKDAVAAKGGSARLHSGAIAQRISEAFSSAGLDASRYGLFCYDEWASEEASYDGEGHLVCHGLDAGNLYSLRYAEALCMEAAYQRRENARLKRRIAGLEERLAALELKIS